MSLLLVKIIYQDGIAVARKSRSRVSVTVVNLCALVGRGNADASGNLKGFPTVLAPSYLRNPHSLAIIDLSLIHI